MGFNGFGKITSFTIRQQMKTAAFKATTIITILLVVIVCAAVNIVPAVISRSEVDAPQSLAEVTLDKVYFYNETDIGAGVTEVLSGQLPNTSVVTVSDANAVTEEFKTSDKNEILLKLTKSEDGGYSLLSVMPANGDNSDDSDLVLYYTASLLDTLRLTEAGVPAEKIASVTSEISTESVYADEEVESFEEMIIKMYVPMFIGIIMFLLIYMYGYWVATSVVTEKSSRVMELLLTSVRPNAVMLGKLLGMGILAFAQFALVAGSGTVAYLLSDKIAGGIAENYSKLDLSVLIDGINPVSVAAVIVVFAIGYIFYAEINAIAGATVSSSEDLQMALTPVNILVVIGFYLAYMAPSIGNETLTNLALLLPISSPFYLPSAILMGEVGIGMAALSLAILAASTVIIFLFAARIYHSIILHTGTRLKISDLFKIYKQK